MVTAKEISDKMNEIEAVTPEIRRPRIVSLLLTSGFILAAMIIRLSGCPNRVILACWILAIISFSVAICTYVIAYQIAVEELNRTKGETNGD